MAQVISVLDSYTYPPCIGQIVIQRMVVPMMGGEPDADAIEAATPLTHTAMGALEQLLGDQQFVAGGAVSLADFHLVPIFDYFRQTPEGAAVVASRPGLRSWWERMAGRDSVQATEPRLG